jgi:hypothetical protein
MKRRSSATPRFVAAVRTAPRPVMSPPSESTASDTITTPSPPSALHRRRGPPACSQSGRLPRLLLHESGAIPKATRRDETSGNAALDAPATTTLAALPVCLCRVFDCTHAHQRNAKATWVLASIAALAALTNSADGRHASAGRVAVSTSSSWDVGSMERLVASLVEEERQHFSTAALLASQAAEEAMQGSVALEQSTRSHRSTPLPPSRVATTPPSPAPRHLDVADSAGSTPRVDTGGGGGAGRVKPALTILRAAALHLLKRVAPNVFSATFFAGQAGPLTVLGQAAESASQQFASWLAELSDDDDGDGDDDDDASGGHGAGASVALLRWITVRVNMHTLHTGLSSVDTTRDLSTAPLTVAALANWLVQLAFAASRPGAQWSQLRRRWLESTCRGALLNAPSVRQLHPLVLGLGARVAGSIRDADLVAALYSTLHETVRRGADLRGTTEAVESGASASGESYGRPTVAVLRALPPGVGWLIAEAISVLDPASIENGNAKSVPTEDASSQSLSLGSGGGWTR